MGYVMSLEKTPVCEFGWKAKDFRLLGTNGTYHTLESTMGENGLLLMFICNHCPYVKKIQPQIGGTCEKLQRAGIGCIAIMSNDTEDYPEDSLDNMQRVASKFHYPFPYVIDTNQEIALAYKAACTPDFFGFNKKLCLQYRGRLDNQPMSYSSHQNKIKEELLEAMLTVATTGKGPETQYPSMGCSIKFRRQHRGI